VSHVRLVLEDLFVVAAAADSGCLWRWNISQDFSADKLQS
jgi:hypothetical protein